MMHRCITYIHTYIHTIHRYCTVNIQRISVVSLRQQVMLYQSLILVHKARVWILRVSSS